MKGVYLKGWGEESQGSKEEAWLASWLAGWLVGWLVGWQPHCLLNMPNGQTVPRWQHCTK